ncbi:hypothetical protein BD779DRAFT_78849 [Infundibulicybe gibba]|nr:hypothetical protein BD779DRAFT_78849 [Infundibulicybe gibba]
MKRRHRDDSPDQVAQKPPPPRKRARSARKPSSDKSGENTVVEKSTASLPPNSPNAEPANSDITPSHHSGLTFLESSSSSSSVTDDNRASKSRAVLPVPVPNLTKKSRGRRVPTALVPDKDGEQKATRLYVCDVDGCGKCFNRGEHLKRHIRSIHTHEKPFKCSYPACDKFFNRHDNLLQHLKVHKELANPQPSYPDVSTAPVPALSQPRLYPPLEETHENISIQLSRSHYHQQGSFPTYSTTTPYGSI